MSLRSRRYWIAAVLISSTLAACGESTPPSPPPPPPPPPLTPATVAVNGGDGQEAEPGKAVAVAPSVVVRAANGAAVPNVTVAFALDSGRGSIASASGTTDAAGIASPGGWTLGPVEGSQILSAAVGVLPKATIRATARFAPTTVPTGGGTVTINRPSSPLNGLTITVPAGAYPTASAWTVSEVPNVRPALPAKVRQIGPAIRVSNGQGFAAKPFIISMPVRLPRDSAVAAFFRDPASGKLEAIPILARTDSTLALLASHVSADQLLLPTGSAPSLSAGGAAPPGAIEILLVGGLAVDLRVRFGTSFRPGVDDWEFANYGSLASPGGYCVGSTLSALYHNYARKAAEGALFGLYDSIPGLNSDNPGGIRLASVVQETIDWDDGASIKKVLEEGVGVALGTPGWVRTQMEGLSLAMLVTGQAQQLTIYQSGLEGAHAIDGSVIAGNHSGSTQAVRWTASGGVQFLSIGYGYDVSADGSVVVGFDGYRP